MADIGAPAEFQRQDRVPDIADQPRVLRNGKIEEGEARGDGWVALRALAILAGGMMIFSYLILA